MKKFKVEIKFETVAENGFGQKSIMVMETIEFATAENEVEAVKQVKARYEHKNILRIGVL